MEHFPHLTAVCDLITDLMDLDMKPMGVGPVCRILAKRREEDGHPRGERSHLKDEERYALCGLGELITYSRDEQMPQNETEATRNG